MAKDLEDLSGRLFGGCRLDRLISRGRLGDLYLAWQVSIARTVVVRLLAPHLTRDERWRARFLRVARAAARKTDPHLVSVLDAGVDGARAWCVLEHVPGESLADRFARGARLDWPEALRILHEASRGLWAAEQAGVSHGTLEPRRLLFAPTGETKVLGTGFGELALRSGPAGALPPEIARHRAPESIVRGGDRARIDMWALGSILLQGLSGAPASPRGLGTEAALAALPPHAPPGATTILRALLDPLQLAAPDGFGAVVRATQPLLALPATAPSAPTTQPPRPRPIRRPRPTPWLLAGAASLAIASASWLSWRALERPRSEPGAQTLESRAPHAASTATPTRSPETRPPTDGAHSDIDPNDGAAGHPTTSPPTPARGDGLGLQRITDLRTRLSAGSVDPFTAHAELSRLETEHGGEVTFELAAVPLRARIRALCDDLGARIIVDEIDPLVADGRFAEAQARLDEYLARGPARSIARARSEVRARATRALEAAREEIAALATPEALARGRERLEALARNLPEDLARQCRELGRSLDSDLERRSTRAAALDEAEAAVRRELAAGRFDAAIAAVEALPAPDADETTARGPALGTRVLDARSAELALRRSLERLAADRTARVRLTSTRTGELGADPLAVDGLDPSSSTPAIRLRAASGRDALRSVADLCDADLLELRTAGDDAPPTLAEAVRSVGVWLAYRDGPARAWTLLVENDALPPAERSAWASWLDDEARPRLETAVELLAHGIEDAPAEAFSLDAWSGVQQELRVLIAESSRLPGFAPHRERLEQLHGRVAAATAELSGFDALVRGATRRKAPDTWTVVYEFEAPEELADFVVVAGKAEIRGGRLVIDGECRLLAGEPFFETLSVQATVPDYPARAPNIGIALWTSSRDRLTPPKDPDSPPKRKEKPDYGTPDYVLFSIGHYPRGPSASDGSDRVVGIVGTEHKVGLPAFAILAGRRLEPDATPDSDASAAIVGALGCLWAESTLNKVRGPQRIDLRLGPEAFVWSTGRLALHGRAMRRAPSLPRILRACDARGSVQLLSRTGEIAIDSLRVEGRLAPDWVRAEALRRARKEFLSLAGPPPPPAASEKEDDS